MTLFRSTLLLAWVSAVLLATGAGGEPPRAAPKAPAPAEDGALDATPAPGGAATVAAPARVQKSPELPPAARSGVWRDGARKPEDAPASAVVRAALRKPSPNAKSRQQAGPEADASRAIEIVWNAPGS